MNKQHVISLINKTFVVSLTEKVNTITLSNKNYVPVLVEKIIESDLSFLLTTESDFLRTQDGNFLIL